MTDDIVAITRHCPDTHESVIFVAHCAFRVPENEDIPDIHRTFSKHVPPVVISGKSYSSFQSYPLTNILQKLFL